MVRVITFQSLLMLMGITGSIFSTFCVPSSGPVLKLVLFWNGALIMLPTGFCAIFANSSLVNSAKDGAATSNAVEDRVTVHSVLIQIVIDYSPKEN